MTILTANLKHLYQRRGAWLLYLFILSQVPVYIIMGIKAERYLGYLFISVFTGLIVASIQKEIISKPFSFCLPAHNEIPREFILWVGLVVNGLLGCLFVFHPTVEPLSVAIVALAGGVVGMIVYLLCAASTLFLRVQSGKYTWPLMIIVFYGVVFKKWDVAFQEMIVTSPLVVIGLGSLLCWLVWRRIDIGSLKRKSCGKIAMTLFDWYNKEKVAKYKLARLAEKEKKKPNSLRRFSGVEGFFVSRINRAEIGSLQQYIWGSLYKSFGRVFSRRRQDWMIFLVIILPMLCLLCYIPGNMKNLIFIVPGFTVIHMSLWVHSSLSVSGGRRERFWSALTLAAATGIFVTVAAVLLATGTNLVENIMPLLMIKGHEFVFSAVDMKFSLVPLLMIPVTFTIGLIFHKKPVLKRILLIGTVYLLMVLCFAIRNNALKQFVEIWPVLVVVLLLCIWGGFIWVLRYISMRCCLVTQTK